METASFDGVAATRGQKCVCQCGLLREHKSLGKEMRVARLMEASDVLWQTESQES